MEECSPFVLARVIDFMYDIKLPAEFSYEDAKALLAMADLYMMEDLKDVAGSFIADGHLTKNIGKANILEISQMAEKFAVKTLKEGCYEFVFNNVKSLNKEVLAELYKALPNLGEMSWHEIVSKGRPQEGAADILMDVLGIDLTEEFKFKRRRDFQSEIDYILYVMDNIKPNMLVLRNKPYSSNRYDIPVGAIGRVVDVDFTEKEAKILWFGKKFQREPFHYLDLRTSPMLDLCLEPKPCNKSDI